MSSGMIKKKSQSGQEVEILGETFEPGKPQEKDDWRGQFTDRDQMLRYLETGERLLFVSPSFLKSIVGLAPRESEQILEFLWEHVVRTEYTVRFKWEPGDIAMWDNRSTAHLAPTDIFASDFDRQLYRITLVGDVPVGVDGRSSVSLKGKPILAVETELTAAAG